MKSACSAQGLILEAGKEEEKAPEQEGVLVGVVAMTMTLTDFVNKC